MGLLFSKYLVKEDAYPSAKTPDTEVHLQATSVHHKTKSHEEKAGTKKEKASAT